MRHNYVYLYTDRYIDAGSICFAYILSFVRSVPVQWYRYRPHDARERVGQDSRGPDTWVSPCHPLVSLRRQTSPRWWNPAALPRPGSPPAHIKHIHSKLFYFRLKRKWCIINWIVLIALFKQVYNIIKHL